MGWYSPCCKKCKKPKPAPPEPLPPPDGLNSWCPYSQQQTPPFNYYLQNTIPQGDCGGPTNDINFRWGRALQESPASNGCRWSGGPIVQNKQLNQREQFPNPLECYCDDTNSLGVSIFSEFYEIDADRFLIWMECRGSVTRKYGPGPFDSEVEVWDFGEVFNKADFVEGNDYILRPYDNTYWPKLWWCEPGGPGVTWANDMSNANAIVRITNAIPI